MLTPIETEQYLAHRMAIAGYAGDAVFGKLAVRVLHRPSWGVPRLINILANKALMLAYGEGVRRVGWGHARAAVRDTPAATGWRQLWTWLVVACVACSSIGWLFIGSR